MKFENPIMNISMFEVENIVTDSTTPTPDIEKATFYANNNIERVSEILSINFTE